MTNTSFLRDVKLGISTGDYKVTIDLDGLPSSSYFFSKKRKTIKDIMKRGAILVGSRALNCYRINGKKIINRNPDDWDFVITTDQFLELCRDYKIYDFDLTKPKYLLNKSFATFSDYGDSSYWFRCLIQLIIKDEDTPYEEVNGIKFATLDSIIESKLNLAKIETYEMAKHRKDINNIMVNIHSI